MKLLPSAGSDRAWVWTVLADFADETAIRFKNAENAQKFKTAFEQCQESIEDGAPPQQSANDGEEDLSKNMSKLAGRERSKLMIRRLEAIMTQLKSRFHQTNSRKQTAKWMTATGTKRSIMK